jgi:hypothetical protein
MTRDVGRLAGTPERELALRLAATEACREQEREQIAALAARVDYTGFVELLQQFSLLPLLGSRLTAITEVPRSFRARLEDAKQAVRLRSEVTDRAMLDAYRALETEGIVALPLRSPLLTPRVEILVRPGELQRAEGVLTKLGYAAKPEPRWVGELPLLHSTLAPPKPWLPGIELHWRVHWYEHHFSATLLASSTPEPEGVRRLPATEDIALRLVLYARDGLYGLRWVADLAAWWDAHAESLESGALTEFAQRHPNLRSTLMAAGDAASALAGLPAAELIAGTRPAGARLASRLAHWHGRDTAMELVSVMTLVDLLLAPPGKRGSWVTRHVLQPEEHIAQTYGLDPDAHARVRVRRIIHGGGATVRFSPRFTRALWRLRRGRTLIASPSHAAPRP